MEKFWQDGPAVRGDLLSHIITTRSLITSEISPVWPDGLHDPFLLPDMEKAVNRVMSATASKEPIGIVGDYDMDGAPAAALVFDFLTLYGASPEVVLPTRSDGYGFTPEILARLKAKGVKLIITVDCGIKSYEAIDLASKAGIDVVVTDHHECEDRLPSAVAVVNPKRADSRYPFAGLSGTGVAFKLIQALTRQKGASKKIPATWLAWSLDLVALATLADMVPLIDENRLMVMYGLKVLKRARRVGVRLLLADLNIAPDALTYRDISFKIVPKLNAAGRIDHMDEVFTLLTTKSQDKAQAALSAISHKQFQSKLQLTQTLKEAQALVSPDQSKWIVVANEGWPNGVTGLVAHRLAETFGRPALVLGSGGKGILRGSGRASGGVNMVKSLEAVASHLKSFGGHRDAVGLTLSSQNVAQLREDLEKIELPSQDEQPVVSDGLVEPSQLTILEMEKMNQLAPWGIGNTDPLWSLPGVAISDRQWMGNNQHLKLHLGLSGVEAVYFNANPIRETIRADKLDLLATASVNEFRGKRTVQLILLGVAPSGDRHG